MANSSILWCVHIIGPDDVCAAPDFDTAEEWAMRQNRFMREYTKASGMENDPNWPETRAVVAVWPWDAESHAKDLHKSIADFTPLASADTLRMAETGTGSGRSPSGAVSEGETTNA